MKCLARTRGCFCCGKYDHKVGYCPFIADRGKESKKVSLNDSKDDVPKAKAGFFALRARGSNPDENGDDDEGKFFLFLVV